MFILKLATALVAIACVVHAAPTGQACPGGACFQSASSGQIDVGSTTNIVPVTQVTPVTRYQPIVQALAPIVQSECGQPLGGAGFDQQQQQQQQQQPQQMMFPQQPQQEQGPSPMMGGFGYARGFGRPMYLSRAGRMMVKRHHHLQKQEQHEAERKMMFRPDCVPSATDSCLVSLESGKTDLGSSVVAVPSNIIKPLTEYQGRVQSKGPEVYAAEAQHAQLSQSNVNIASETKIQPETHVRPEVTYQPEVENKATLIESEASDASLARSSVSLGSTVTIRPVTKVEPLTTFQPKVMSLPFIIKDYGCGHASSCGCA
ncbi:hypothetical protein BGZ94_000934 [Podila epigama]|nr:hypothetical protein BGZ94_000934 [Podila epigama]